MGDPHESPPRHSLAQHLTGMLPKKRHCDFQKQLEKLTKENHSRKAAAGKIPAASGSPGSLQEAHLLCFMPFSASLVPGAGRAGTLLQLSERGWDLTLLFSDLLLQERPERPQHQPCIPK